MKIRTIFGLTCLITTTYFCTCMNILPHCPLCRNPLIFALPGQGNDIWIVNLHEIVPNAGHLYILCHRTCLLSALSTHVDGEPLIDEPLYDGFTMSAVPEIRLNLAPTSVVLRYQTTIETPQNIQPDSLPADIHADSELAVDYRHISNIEQIMSRYDEQQSKFDLYGLGIEQIDAHVFEQMAQMQKPVRWLDLSCNRMAELPIALEALPAHDLVLQVNRNPFIAHPEWMRRSYSIKHDNPGWIILDGTL